MFLKSAASPKDFPGDQGREAAFVGRSNSGKSTALNLMVGARKLARVSKTPGRTQLVNFFSLGDGRRLVDLPGYGFARAAPEVQARWRSLIETYLRDRASLVGLVLTVDIRRGVTELDDQLLRWLESRRALPVAVLLTKADKLSRSEGLEVERQVKAQLGSSVLVTRFSREAHEGVEAARGWLDSWLTGT